jgi:hypothetical protein
MSQPTRAVAELIWAGSKTEVDLTGRTIGEGGRIKGRRPIPTRLKIVRANPSRRALNTDEPASRISFPSPADFNDPFDCRANIESASAFAS